jgi:hypothetical protein
MKIEKAMKITLSAKEVSDIIIEHIEEREGVNVKVQTVEFACGVETMNKLDHVIVRGN